MLQIPVLKSEGQAQPAYEWTHSGKLQAAANKMRLVSGNGHFHGP